jgi:hypothetical protein
MNINCLVPSDAYATLQVAGFISLMAQYMHCPTGHACKILVFFFWGGEVGGGGGGMIANENSTVI